MLNLMAKLEKKFKSIYTFTIFTGDSLYRVGSKNLNPRGQERKAKSLSERLTCFPGILLKCNWNSKFTTFIKKQLLAMLLHGLDMALKFLMTSCHSPS